MKSFFRRGGVPALVASVAATLAFSASALAAPTTGTDLPTTSPAYNAAWQGQNTWAPGYITPSNDGVGVAPGKIGHVWVIVLENHAYDASFTPLEGTENSYLENLPQQGALLTNYYGTGHSSLDNYTSMVSGQGPVADDQDDCPSYNLMAGTMDTSGTPASNSDFGQFQSAAGADAPPYDNGCVYPDSVDTVFNQLNSQNESWKVYAQDVDTAGGSAGSSDSQVPAAGQDAGIADCGAPESSTPLPRPTAAAAPST